MNREQMIKDRDAYLAKLQEQLSEHYPNAMNFYEDPANYTTSTTPESWKAKENSKRGLGKSKSTLSDSELIHLLKRTKIGVSPTEYEAFKDLNVEQIVQMLLTEEEIGMPVNDYNNGGNVFDPDVPFGETFVGAPYNGDLEGERTMANKSWFLEESIRPSTSMHSTMWLFWHNHLVTEMWAIFNGTFQYKYLKLLHDHAFGNFKDMMYQITLDPSMLLYLNGFVNIKDAPDENYGREVQELFCVGKGPNANYTESDVQAAARILTGWNIDWNQGEATFYSWDHNTEDKQFSEFYGNTLIEGRTGEEGRDELQEFFDMIFSNDEVALFIVRKLYTYFVFSTIDDWAEENIIQPLAQIFRDNDYNVKPVLEALFMSDHFYDPVNYGAVIKSPVDVLIGWWKSMEVQYPFDAEEDIHNKNLVHRAIVWRLSSWGQQVGDPPNVAGWPAYYQHPNYDKTWITTSTILPRIEFTSTFLWWGFWSQNHVVTFDLLEFAKGLDNSGDPNWLIAYLEKLFCGVSLSVQLKSSLKGILLSGQTEDYYWTNAWNAFLADESNETNQSIVRERLRNTLLKFFQLSETQLK